MTNDQARMTNEARIPNDEFVIGHLSLIGHSGLVIGAFAVLLLAFGCEKSAPLPPLGKSPRIASLVPAATDLLVGMNAGDHLVAVSNYDANRADIRNLSCVGDYQNTDWEKLAQLRPDIMIVFMSGDRMPVGLQQRADQLHIRLVNVKTERLEDIFQTIDLLGQLLTEPQKASLLAQKIRLQLDAVGKRVSGLEKVPTLLMRDDDGFALIAGDTFADDLLSIAGGKNVAGDFKVRYPSVDAERVVELAPRAVIQLMPDATPAAVEQLHKRWEKLPGVSAVKEDRVYTLTEWYVVQPGSHVGDLAEKMASVLHPVDSATTTAAN